MLEIQLKHFWHKFRIFLLLILTVVLVIACQNNTSKKLDPNTKPSSTEDCRVISHSMGETCVPNNPQRIIMLNHLDNALVLGIKPVGAVTVEGTKKFDSLLPQQTKGIESIGLRGEPSLEKIIQLKPDLIMSSYPKKNYQLLSAIAPTVLFDDSDKAYKNWKDRFRAYANALGKTQAANEILNTYQQRVAEFGRAMGDRLSNTQVSLVNFYAIYVRIYFKQFFGGQILEEVGLSRPPAQDRDRWKIDLALEAIPQMVGGDAIFLMLGNHDRAKLEQYTSHPLWTNLEAVRQGKVYEVDSEVWGGDTPVAANMLLDDLFKYLVKE